MKLIKAIKLHWRLRIRQEYVCNKVIEHSQIITGYKTVSPYLSELSSVNKAVRNVEKKIPDIYFFLSDLLGGASLLKRRCEEYTIRERQKELEEDRRIREIILNNLICWDLIASPGFH